MKQHNTNGLARVRSSFAPMVRLPEASRPIQKVTQLTRLSSTMEPLESRTLMSAGQLTSDVPLLAVGKPAAMKVPVSNLKSAPKTPVKVHAPVKTPAPVSAPAGLVANGCTPTSIKLNWSLSGSNASSVLVLRSTDGVHFTQVTKISSATASSYVDNGLKENVSYKYEVQSVGAGGVTATSPMVGGATLLIAPSGLQTTVATGGAVQLVWQENDPTASGYTILRSSDGVNFSQIGRLSTTSTNPHTFSDNTAGSLTKYYYEVIATNQVTASPASTSTSATTPLAAPMGLVPTALSPTSVSLSWVDNDPMATGYSILRATAGGAFSVVKSISSGQTLSWTDTTLSANTAYAYEVKATHSTSTSVATAVARITTPLVAPTSLAASVSSGSVALSWTNNDNTATGFTILRSLDGVHFAPLTTVTGAGTTTYTDSGVQSGHAYSYQVVATAAAVRSAVSNTTAIITPLVAPSGLTVNGQSGNAVLTWTNNDSFATGYTISRSTNGTTFTVIQKLAGGTINTFTDSTTLASTTYYYKVTATNAIASSTGGTAIQVNMPVGMPSGLTATASGSTVALSWTDKDPLATGYNILRSSDGATYTQIDTLTISTASTYTDSTVSTGAKYFYEVQAVNGSALSSVSNSANAVVPLLAPTGLTVTATAGSAVLTWTNADTAATGYTISRSTDGINFTLLTKLSSGSATTYSDSTVTSANTYYYQIQATNTVAASPLSGTSQVAMPVQTVTGLTATAGSTGVVLNWTDVDPSATGYKVLRSTDNSTFTALTTVTQGNATTYTDYQVTSGTQYYYQVQVLNGSVSSVASTTANATATVTPPSPTTVKITTRYTNELVITATGATDTVSVSQSGSTLTITANGQVTQQPLPANGLFIYARGGTDGITVGSSVTVQTTIEAIDGAVDTITSAGTNVGVWDDSNDIFTGTGTAHTVSSFAGNVSKASGASLPDPTDAGTTMKIAASLWGSGPVPADINQGQVGDCYFMSSMAGFALQNPKLLQQSAVDMGDGTYTMQYENNGTPTFIRVSNDISTYGGGGYMYARPGASGSVWGAILEKAFAYFRTGANTYNSINSGWMGSVYALLGVNSTFFNSSAVTTDAAMYSKLSADLSSHKVVTMGTFSSPPNLVGGHAYTLISVSQSKGVGQYVVRNPWGVSGDKLENSQGYATLTYAQFVANFADVCEATS